MSWNLSGVFSFLFSEGKRLFLLLIVLPQCNILAFSGHLDVQLCSYECGLLLLEIWSQGSRCCFRGGKGILKKFLSSILHWGNNWFGSSIKIQ